MYFKIITFLIFVMVMYYAVMIVLDIRAQKAKAAADAEKDPEVDIDISDEAGSFKPVLVSRDEKISAPLLKEGEGAEGESDFSDKKWTENPYLSGEIKPEDEKNFRRSDYREPIMTGGYLVEDLIEEIDKEAEDRDSDLAQIIHVWERA